MADPGLVRLLRRRNQGEELAHDLKNIKDKAEPLLSRIVQTFPDYTTHDIRHSLQVLENLPKIVAPRSLIREMNKYEIYFLAAATYLHDIGMVNFPELAPHDITDEEDLRNYIRENHHLRSEQFIRTNFEDLAIEDEHQANIIGRICRGHRKEDLGDVGIFEPDIMYRDCAINVPLLCSLLRIADELDLTFERAPLIVYEHVDVRDKISREEWQKHLSVSGVGLAPGDPLTIRCSAVVKNPRIHRALKSLETKINRQLEDLPNHLHQYNSCRKDLPRRFTAKIRAVGYEPHDFKFSLKESAIFSLLMGERLYGRKEESLREVLKNSVDACRARREFLKKHGTHFDPHIMFELSPDRRRLTVRDNGIGMSEDEIERYFARIGESYYRSQKFLEADLTFTPLSELGIGILSCFMMADKIAVETRTDESDPILIEVDDISDFFIVRPGKMDEPGTVLTLFLKNDLGRKLDLRREIRLYGHHLEFPIKVKTAEGGEILIEDDGFNPNPQAFLTEGFETRFAFHTIRIVDDYVEGIIAFPVRKTDTLGLEPMSIGDLLSGTRDVSSRPPLHLVSNEGVLTSIDFLLPDPWLMIRFYQDLNLRRNPVDLNIARNTVMYNDRRTKFENRVEELLVQGLARSLRDVRLKAKEMGCDPTHNLRAFFIEHIKDDGVLEHVREKTNVSSNFLDFVRLFFPLRCASTKGVRYMTCEEAMKENRPVVLFDGFRRADDQDVEYFFTHWKTIAEDTLYVVPTRRDIAISWAALGKPIVLAITKTIEYEESSELADLLPQGTPLIRFKDYATTRFAEVMGECVVISDHDFKYPMQYLWINRENPFVDLLVQRREAIRNREIDIKLFFVSVMTWFDQGGSERQLSLILEKQKEIVSWLVDFGLGKKAEEYVLTLKDFPSMNVLG